MKNTNDFLKKNLNIYHIIGMVVGVGLCMIYWAKAGRFSSNFLKSSPILMAIWGLLVGYLLCDLMFNANNRRKEDKKDHDENKDTEK